jgi:hypothetical protein
LNVPSVAKGHDSHPVDATSEPDDITQLREQWPGWTFGTVWASAGTGPDQRRIWAVRGGFMLSAWSAAELSASIRRDFGTPPPARDAK